MGFQLMTRSPEWFMDAKLNAHDVITAALVEIVSVLGLTATLDEIPATWSMKLMWRRHVPPTEDARRQWSAANRTEVRPGQ